MARDFAVFCCNHLTSYTAERETGDSIPSVSEAQGQLSQIEDGACLFSRVAQPGTIRSTLFSKEE